MVLEQLKSCGSVSCLINTEPLELLRLQPIEPVASESAVGELFLLRVHVSGSKRLLHFFLSESCGLGSFLWNVRPVLEDYAGCPHQNMNGLYHLENIACKGLWKLRYNEGSTADSLFRKENAQLYLFTWNSTHFTLQARHCTLRNYFWNNQ